VDPSHWRDTYPFYLPSTPSPPLPKKRREVPRLPGFIDELKRNARLRARSRRRPGQRGVLFAGSASSRDHGGCVFGRLRDPRGDHAAGRPGSQGPRRTSPRSLTRGPGAPHEWVSAHPRRRPERGREQETAPLHRRQSGARSSSSRFFNKPKPPLSRSPISSTRTRRRSASRTATSNLRPRAATADAAGAPGIHQDDAPILRRGAGFLELEKPVMVEVHARWRPELLVPRMNPGKSSRWPESPQLFQALYMVGPGLRPGTSDRQRCVRNNKRR